MITTIPAGVEIPWEGIRNGADFNDDGHGFAIASREHGLEMFKSMKFEETGAALLDARAKHGKSSIVLFHSRWATHGVTAEFNVHPFYTDESGDTVMAHNGVLPIDYHPKKGDPRSDTRIFNDRMLEQATRNGIPSRRTAKRLGQGIGMGNKLAFLSVKTGEPKLRIVNAFLGTHSEGVWYSNDGFLPSRFSWRGWKDDRPIDPMEPWVEGEISSDCSICQSIGSVDTLAGICDVCECCVDCDMFITDCLCYAGNTELWAVNSTVLDH